MALNITCKICKICAVYFGDSSEGECRLNPPTPISSYASAYPIVRANNPGCSCGSVLKATVKARAKKVTKKTKEA